MIAVVFEILKSALAVGEVTGGGAILFTSQSETHIKDMLVWRKVFTLTSKLSEFFSEAYC